MAKGIHLTPEVRELIARIYLDHPDYGPAKIHKELHSSMEKASLDKKYGSDWPGISVVGKEVREIRARDIERPPELKALDKPWSLATLDETPIPPELIPIVLDVKQNWPFELNPTKVEARRVQLKKELQGKDDPVSKSFLEHIEEESRPLLFTVREAKWTARIAPVLKDKLTLGEIGRWAHAYALREREYEVGNIEFSTSQLDNALLLGDIQPFLLWWIVVVPFKPTEEEVQKIERGIIGHSLEGIELTPKGGQLYLLWLFCVEKYGKKWPNLSIKEREDFVKRLRAWVIEREPVEEFMCPYELLMEVDYTVSRSKILKEKEAQNERKHKAKKQE